MEQTKSKFAVLFEDASELLHKKTDLFMLGLAEKTSNIVSTIAVALILTVISVFILIFGSIALAWWIGQLLGSLPMGFCSLALFYVLLFVITLVFFKRVIQNIVIGVILKHILHEKEY